MAAVRGILCIKLAALSPPLRPAHTCLGLRLTGSNVNRSKATLAMQQSPCLRAPVSLRRSPQAASGARLCHCWPVRLCELATWSEVRVEAGRLRPAPSIGTAPRIGRGVFSSVVVALFLNNRFNGRRALEQLREYVFARPL